MNFNDYVLPELLILVPVLYGLGAVIKNTEKIKDNYIPALLTLCGVVLSCLYVIGTQGISAEAVFTSIVQGILVAAAAVYANQLIKQSSK